MRKKFKSLTKKQEDALKKHSVHHTPKHMSEMKKAMKDSSGRTEIVIG